jgi:hypothetical protein
VRRFHPFQPGDVAVIFNPDDTALKIVLNVINRGIHVMVTKPNAGPEWIIMPGESSR